VNGLGDIGQALIHAWTDPGGVRTLRVEIKEVGADTCTVELWEGPNERGTSTRIAAATGPHEWVCDAIVSRIMLRKAGTL